jgi:hypothetical protein
MNPNWQAGFELWLVETVKVTRLQWHFATLANRVICERYTQSHRLIFVFSWNISIQNELTFSTAQNGSM